MTEKELRNWIADVPDFPKKGVLFRDMTPLLGEPKAFSAAIDQLLHLVNDLSFNRIVGIEARGFILGSAMALRLGCSFVPARKPGKLPRKTVRVTFDLEYGSDALELHAQDIKPSDRILIVDDVLATGGTARACDELVGLCGAHVEGHLFLLEIEGLQGRKQLNERKVRSLLKF